MRIISLQAGPLDENCYIAAQGADGNGICAVIDPGGSSGKICAKLEEEQLRPCCILLTHGHFDHTGAVRDLLERYPGIPVYINRLDVDENEHFYHLLSGEGQRYYGDGDEVDVGGLKLCVIATPGHSPGSVCLLAEDALFSGDTLFDGSCGRTDLPGGRQSDMDASLAKLAKLPGELRVFPGHMEATTLKEQLQTNPFLRQAAAAGPHEG